MLYFLNIRIAGKELETHIEHDREINQEDVAPPFLSQHNVFPAGWNYIPDDKPTHSMAFLMPPPYHSTKQLLLTSQKQYLNINNNDEQMANKNYQKYSQQMSSESDEFGFDMHSVVSMEILENQDQYKQTLKHFPQQKLTTFVEAKNNEVLRRVAEMQKMVENSQRYLNENVNENSFPNRNGNSNDWRETSVDVESDTESLSSNKQSSETNSSAPPPGVLKHSDSLTLLAETIKNDLNGINSGLNSIYTPFDCHSNGSTTCDASTAPSSVSNTPKVQRRLNGLSQIISDLQALGNDSSDCDSESLYTPNSSPIHRNNNNGTINQSNMNSNQLRVPSTQKTFKQIRTSFGLHSPDALGDSKDNNLREYLRQLKEASCKDNNSDQDLAAKKLAELYGFELGDDFIETDPDLIDLTTIPPPQTPDELDIPNSVLNAPPSGFDDVDGGQRRQTSNRDLEEFLKKVTIEPPTKIVTPAIELTPEEIMSFIIPPPPKSVSDQKVLSSSVKPKLAPLNVKPAQSVKPQTPSLKPVPLPKPNREIQNCNSFYDNHHGIMNFCDHSHSNTQTVVIEEGPGTPENNVKNKVLMFTNGHQTVEYATVDRKGQFNYSPKSQSMNGSHINGSISSSDDNESLKLPPKRTLNGHTCGKVPDRPPKSAELQLKLNSPVRMIHNYGAYSLYNNTDINPPSLPPRVNEKSPPQSDTLRRPPLPPIPAKPTFFPNSPNGSPSIKSPLPLFKTSSANSSPIRSVGSPHFQHRHYNTMREGGERNMFNFNHAMISSGINPLSPTPMNRQQANGHLLSSTQNGHDKIPLSVLCSPQLNRKPCNHLQVPGSPQLSNKNGHVINVATLMAKTNMAMSGLLVKLDQVAVMCSDAQSAGGGSEIDEDKFQRSKDELTDVSLRLVTASKLLVIAMSDNAAKNLPEHLTACLTALRRVTELAQDLVRFTSAPLQTRNIVLKIHDVASSFREMVCVPVGQSGAGQLALNANCLANVLATLLRSLRVFSP